MFENISHVIPTADVIKKSLPILHTIGEQGLNLQNLNRFFNTYNLPQRDVDALIPRETLMGITKVVNAQHTRLKQNVTKEVLKNIALTNENSLVDEGKGLYRKQRNKFDPNIEGPHTEEPSEKTRSKESKFTGTTTNIYDYKTINKHTTVNTHTTIDPNEFSTPFRLNARPTGNTQNLIYLLIGILLVSLVLLLIFYVNKKRKYGELYTFKDFLKELYVVLRNAMRSMANSIIKAYVNVIAAIIVLITISLMFIYIIPPPKKNAHPIILLIYNAIWSFINKARIVKYDNE